MFTHLLFFFSRKQILLHGSVFGGAGPHKFIERGVRSHVDSFFQSVSRLIEYRLHYDF